MASFPCNIGELSKTADGIVVLKITCTGDEITMPRMAEAVTAIDSLAAKPAPLLIDATLSHSISFDALFEMAKATKVAAVAIYAPSEISQRAAEYVETFHRTIKKAPYPFKIFSNPEAAKEWLIAFHSRP